MMHDLIARLEAAPEGSRKFDAEIAVATFRTISTEDDLIYAKLPSKDDQCAPGTFWVKSRSGFSLQTAPLFTTSLDAAVTLVSEGIPWRIASHDGGSAEIDNGGFCDAATPALALCAAALKALAVDSTTAQGGE